MASDLDDLRLFGRIVEAGSLSEAARRLGSSLPAMSRRLAALEARLGARLIDRGTRRFVPTEEGSLLYERGQVILSDLDALENQVADRTATPFGHLRVGAPNQIGRQRLAALVAGYSRQFPQVSVELVLTDRRLDLIGEELDVGLHVDQPSDASIIVRRLLSSHRVLCASPAYLEAHGAPAVPEDLSTHECLCLVRGRHIYDRWTLTKDTSRQEIHVRGALRSTSAEVVQGWAVAGFGIALKASWDVQEEFTNGSLQEVLPDYRAEPINLYVTYASRVFLPRRTRSFIDYMAEHLVG